MRVNKLIGAEYFEWEYFETDINSKFPSFSNKLTCFFVFLISDWRRTLGSISGGNSHFSSQASSSSENCRRKKDRLKSKSGRKIADNDENFIWTWLLNQKLFTLISWRGKQVWCFVENITQETNNKKKTTSSSLKANFIRLFLVIEMPPQTTTTYDFALDKNSSP